MKVETLSEQLFFTTAFIVNTSSAGTRRGTGFHYIVDTEIGAIPFLISNKHVLNGADELEVHMVNEKDDSPELGKPVVIRLTRPVEIIEHPDPLVDVAAMSLVEALSDKNSSGINPFRTTFSSRDCLTDSVANELDALERITFIGYPSGIYDRANLLPIARSGMSATPIDVDYEGRPAFVIDASVFPGSSGSPVVLSDSGPYKDRSGTLIVGNGRLILLGVLAAVHVRQVSGKVLKLPASKLGFSIDEPIDLGIVYKASAIEQTIDVWLSQMTIQRAESPNRQAST